MFQSVRARVTIVATEVFAIAFIVAAFGLVRVVDDRVHETVRNATSTALKGVVQQILNGTPFEQLQIEGQPVYYQVINSHNVMEASNLSGSEPIQPMTEGVSPRELPGKSKYERLSQRVINPATGKLTYTVQVASSLDSADRSVQTVQRSLLIATPLLIALVAAMVWTFVGRAFRPVAKIREEVESISASTIDRRVPVPDTHDEVARLATMMNAMLDRLESSQLRQRQFVSDASHELRSPIASMRAELEVALAHPDAAQWPAVADRVLSERDRLERLVDDLFALARIEEGQPLRRVEVDLDDIVLAEANHARPKPITTSSVSAGRVVGDRRALEQVVRNLCDNAARFARTTVRIELATEGAEVVLRVDDDGDGVAESEWQRIFERFARSDSGRGREFGGAGLGLALVQRVVAAHHGSVTCSRAPLGGARFEVRLPSVSP